MVRYSQHYKINDNYITAKDSHKYKKEFTKLINLLNNIERDYNHIFNCKESFSITKATWIKLLGIKLKKSYTNKDFLKLLQQGTYMDKLFLAKEGRSLWSLKALNYILENYKDATYINFEGKDFLYFGKGIYLGVVDSNKGFWNVKYLKITKSIHK